MKRVGCLGCSLIEPAPGVYVNGRCRKCRRSRLVQATCETCHGPFEYKSKGSKRNRFCSRKCRMEFVKSKRRKLPPAEVLRDLYLKKNMPTTKIAAMYGTQPRTVGKMLKLIGVPTRKHTKVMMCQHPGCQSRVQKLQHPINGSWYGTLCAVHREEHRTELMRDYRARTLSA